MLVVPSNLCILILCDYKDDYFIQRIGDKVKSRNIRFQAIMKMGVAPSNATCAIRILALRAKYTQDKKKKLKKKSSYCSFWD